MFNQDYSRVYDLIYKNKNYKLETNNLLKLINKYLKKREKNVLEFGCGTGSHCIHYAKYFKKIYLYDKSKSIIDLARNKLTKLNNVSFIKNKDIIKKKVDVVFLLFDVFSYISNRKVLEKNLKLFNKITSNEGLIIFDFWLKESVLKSKPEDYTKKYGDSNIEFQRVCKTKINYRKNIVKINYSIILKNKEFKEIHELRFFSFKEIKIILNSCGYKLVNFYSIDDIKKTLDLKKKWSVLCVAKKII